MSSTTYEITMQKPDSKRSFRTTVQITSEQISQYGGGKAAVRQAVREAAENKHPGWIAKTKSITRRDDRSFGNAMKQAWETIGVPQEEELTEEELTGEEDPYAMFDKDEEDPA